MTHELAKSLKNAGFPIMQKPFDNIGKPNREMMRLSDIESEWFFIPTLSELIEACEGKWGQRFRWLKNNKENGWHAQARPMHPKSKDYPDSPIEKLISDPVGKGKTPEEAVANLWLALQEKVIPK